MILDSYQDIYYALTDRLDGNFADYTGDDPFELEKRRERFSARKKVALLKQLHGDRIIEVKSDSLVQNGAFYFAGEADGMMTNERGLMLAIQSADCAGVLLYDEHNKAVAALHAGRKGAGLNILGKCAAKMADRYGTKPQNLIMYVGAHIRGCCYELPFETAKEFEKYENAVTQRDGRSYLDIAKVLLYQAKTVGIKPQNIEISPSCTSCQSQKYFSYRAENGKCGRMLTAIGLKAI